MFGTLNKDGTEKHLLMWLFDVKGSAEFIRSAARCAPPRDPQPAPRWLEQHMLTPTDMPPHMLAHTRGQVHRCTEAVPRHTQVHEAREVGSHTHSVCWPAPHAPPNRRGAASTSAGAQPQ